MKAAIYARVSTIDQHCEMQLTELRAYSKRMDWEPVEYVEHASGKRGSRRPVLEKLLAAARKREFDVVVVWKIDRFGRSLSDFVENVRILDAHGVRFVAPTQGIDTDQRGPFSRFLMNLLAVFAEFERDLIVERVRAGVTEYRKAYKCGKVGHERQSKSRRNLPHGRQRRIFDRDLARKMRANHASWREIEKALGIPQATIRHALKESAA